MKPLGLRFKSIEIRRMPGFTRGGFEVDGLCDGVNVVYGPNASGKTTLGSAIRRLLRPRDRTDDHDSLRARVELGEAQFVLDYEAGRVTYQPHNKAAPAECPVLAPAEIGDRNLLALEDLIRSEEDRDLAGEIVKELAGGYDVAQARSELGFADRPPRKGKTAKEHEAAKRKSRELLNRQGELLAEEETLAALKSEKTGAQKAQTELVWLDKASKYIEAKERQEAAGLRLDRFPREVAEVTARDVAELDRLKKSLAEARRRQRSEHDKRDEARRNQEESALPAGGLPSGAIVSLQLKSRRLMGMSDDLRHRKELAGQATAELDEARRSVGPHLDLPRAKNLDAGSVEDLFQFAHRVENFRAEKNAARELGGWLRTDGDPRHGEPGDVDTPDVGTLDVDTLEEAIVLLERWLGADGSGVSGASRREGALLIAGGALALLSVVLSVVLMAAVSWWWSLAMGAVAAMIGWTIWSRKQPGASDNRQEEIFRQYESLGVEGPASWSGATVRPHIRQLRRLRDEAALAREKAARFGGLRDRMTRLEEQERTLDSEKRLWIERLGVDVDPYVSESSLALLAANLERFQKARHRLTGAEATVTEVTGGLAALLEEINQAMSAYAIEPAEDADRVAAGIEDLDRRQQAYQLAQKTVLHSEKVLADLDRTIEEETSRQAALFDRVGLSPEDEQRLRELARIRPEYDEAERKCRDADAVFRSAEAALADRPDLIERSAETLATREAECRQSAERLETIGEEIGKIEEAIATAKQSTDLEKILAHQEQCAEALKRERDRDHDAVAGHVLADFVARQQRDTEQPGILRRARELFTKITRGRYELHVHESDRAEFRALETSRREGLGLDELSSGTRLQLLLAVRVAYVERQEQGIKVPLILDETLGNSDEQRAEQIIDAVIEICREGRQVFYFTAQQDELNKWRTMRRHGADVAYHEVDLAEVRQFSHTERMPPMDFEPPKTPRVPSPDGLDWLAYGRRLAVGPIDPNGQIGEVHLWYLIDDPATLHHLLKNGVNRWGQFQSLVSLGSMDEIDSNSTTYRQAEASAGILEEALKAWRVGRGAPVDRSVLTESGAVSPSFIDRLTELAAEVSGDAKAILAALEDGLAKGFRTDKRNALGEYLATAGHLDQRPLLSEEEIRERVRAVMFSALEKELVGRERFEQLVSMAIRRGGDG